MIFNGDQRKFYRKCELQSHYMVVVIIIVCKKCVLSNVMSLKSVCYLGLMLIYAKFEKLCKNESVILKKK